MSSTKRHHYIPVYHLAGFSEEGHRNSWVHALNLQSQSWFKAKPENLAYRKFDHDHALEKVLAEHDGRCAPMLKKLIEGSLDLSNRERLNLLNLVGYGIIRIPHFRNRIRFEYPESYLKKMMIFCTKFFLFSEKFIKGGYKKPEETEKIEEMYSIGDCVVSCSRTHGGFSETLDFGYKPKVTTTALNNLLDDAVKRRTSYKDNEAQSLPFIFENIGILELLPGIILDSRWTLIKNRNNAQTFILADNPVSVSYSDLTNRRGFPSIEIFLPLTKGVALLGSNDDHADFEIYLVDEPVIKALNGLCYRNAYQFIFSGNRRLDDFVDEPLINEVNPREL